MGTASLARGLSQGAVRQPLWTLLVYALLTGLLLFRATGLHSEVGYASYFGPGDPRVAALDDFLAEFSSGLHVVVVIACQGTDHCERATERHILELTGRLQADIDRLPNVRRSWSLLNSPVIVGPLETDTIALRDADGAYQLSAGWEELAARANGEGFLREAVVAADARSAGIVVELQSVASEPTREAVHGLLDLLPSYEAELGREIYLAGDPVWTVVLSDSLDADSTRLTGLMFLVIMVLLFAIFRSFWFTLMPLISVGVLTGACYGIIALLGLSLTTVLSALPPVLVVIAITASIHYVAAFARRSDEKVSEALVASADEVGAGCFWSAVTTAGGFAAFLAGDLESTRNFGLVAAIGLILSFVLTFTLLPALLSLVPIRKRPGPGIGPLRDLLELSLSAVVRVPRFVLGITAVVMIVLAVGATRLTYRSDFGIGEQSFVVRSVRFIEANFRKPMTTEVVVTLPEGTRIYDPESLQLLKRFEEFFSGEPSTGRAWSFLDFLEEAYRVDHGAPAASFQEIVDGAARAVPLAAAQERVSSFWSELYQGGDNGSERYVDRARISVDRAWLDDAAQAPYVVRVRNEIARVNQEYGPRGFRAELAGALPLTDLFLERIRDTQWRSFGIALLVVLAVLWLLLARTPALAAWATAANVLPAVALLGIMGWAGVGIDPANSMVAAILIAIAVDDTIHVSLRYRREREAGLGRQASLVATFHSVGEAVIISSLTLSVGFACLMLSEWGGLVAFGLLASLGVLLALVCDLLLFPAAMLAAGDGQAEPE